MLPTRLRLIFIICIAVSFVRMSWSSAYIMHGEVARSLKECIGVIDFCESECDQADKDYSRLFTQGEPRLDTTKLDRRKILFGRSKLKTHIELHGKQSEVNSKKRDQWIIRTIYQMQSSEDAAILEDLPAQELVHDEFYQISYRLIERGKIKFDDGSHLFIVSTSAHQTKDIGDITIAINEKGEVFINQGHICGGIIHFKTHKKGLPKTSASFLQHFKSDTDDESWVEYSTVDNHKTNQ